MFSTLLKNSFTLIYTPWLQVLFAGMLYCLAFSPFDMPGLIFISFAIFYAHLYQTPTKKTIKLGAVFGLGLFGFGVSWVIISIHDYGNIHYLPAAIITLIFIIYLSCFTIGSALLFNILTQGIRPLFSAFIFAAVWVSFEWLRANLMTGFPWLLAGTSQINTPLKYLAPVIGTYGISFLVCLASAFIANSMVKNGQRKSFYIISAVIIIISPLSMKNIHWTKVEPAPLTTAIIQLNMSMRDKWEDSLFWNILNQYEENTQKSYNNDLIILPESSIPAPDIYVSDFLKLLNHQAKSKKSAILLGILEAIRPENKLYHNALIGLGEAKGHYAKRHLVPFGEYIPSFFRQISQWLLLPQTDIIEGTNLQKNISIKGIPIATLICYEIAYPSLLKNVLPGAAFIVSISDNGWFGHSLASFQQLQMARMLSLQTGRYLALANNDGLSSIIDVQGNVIQSLPAFKSGILQDKIYKASGASPWVIWGDTPLWSIVIIILVAAIILKIIQKLAD
jgi:apolipoprotein N-acyltransferase